MFVQVLFGKSNCDVTGLLQLVIEFPRSSLKAKETELVLRYKLNTVELKNGPVPLRGNEVLW